MKPLDKYNYHHDCGHSKTQQPNKWVCDKCRMHQHKVFWTFTQKTPHERLLQIEDYINKQILGET